jgi:hypothetical protein
MQVDLGVKPLNNMRFRPFLQTLAVVLNISVSVSFLCNVMNLIHLINGTVPGICVAPEL